LQLTYRNIRIHPEILTRCLPTNNVVSYPIGREREELLSQIELRAYLGTKLALAQANLENLTGEQISPFEAVSEGAAKNVGSKFQQRIEIDRNQDGKPVYRWATGNTLAEFTEAVCRIYSEFHNPPSSDVPTHEAYKGVKRSLFEDYVSRWYDMFMEGRLEPTVRPVYKSQLYKHIIPAFKGRYVDEITTQDVQQFLNSRADMAHSTVRDIWNKVKQIFASALEDGLITNNPATSKRLSNPEIGRAHV
jgi:hypothetical protein